MAITHYNITDKSDNHLETLKNTLTTAAASYFTSFSLSEDKLTLTCYDGDNPLLVFNMLTGCKMFKVTLNGLSGVTVSQAGAGTTVTVCQRVSTAACGVGIKFKVGTTDESYGVYITKTKNNKTAVFMQAEKLTTSNSNSIYCISSESSDSGIVSRISGSGTVQKPDHTDLTVISPIVVSGTSDYCPNLFCMVNSQFYGTEGKLDIDGVKYLSNGYYLLKDE